jgi:transcriptional regulator GlxA family with amidase domain
MTNTRIKTRLVSIVIFNGVEVLDFCGPFEVFAVTGERQNKAPFQVVTVAEEMKPIMARGGLSINPSHTFDSYLHPEIVLVPGGIGTRREMNNQKLLGWLKDRAADAELVLSVCSGSLLLAKAGLLDGLSATTHHGAFEELRAVSSRFEIDNSKRFIDNGRVIVSAGISAGIDMSLYVVARLLGKEQALETATYMEYEWSS